MAIIEINNLRKEYNQGVETIIALNGISMTVKKGEFVSIMGSSGSGKSTMMNVLGCLDNEARGQYILDSVDVTKANDDSLTDIRNKKIGFIFQNFNLLPKFSALENVELPLRYAGLKGKEVKEKANNALSKVGLLDRANHKPNELSGGQRQRVAVARALVNNPSILLADEPTGNLDSKSTNEIIKIFQDLNNNGATIIMVTHEHEVAVHTKRVVTFKDGSIIEDKIIAQKQIEI
ncbi:MAG: ABC transporter ATP-binding protein [Lachnospirales bacterium]